MNTSRIIVAVASLAFAVGAPADDTRLKPGDVQSFNGQPGEKGKADPDTEFWALRAIKKELTELEAKITVKEQELADLRKKAGALQAKVVEAEWRKKVDAAIQEARILYPREPAEALEVLSEAAREIDSRGISEGAWKALLNRLATAREELIKKRKGKEH